MKKIILLCLVSLFATTLIHSQDARESGAYYCSKKKSSMTQESLSFLKEMNTVGPTHTYDVLSYTMNLNIYSCFYSPYPKNFSAKTVIHLKVGSTLNSIQLNAD